jgi:hypothetical protein
MKKCIVALFIALSAMMSQTATADQAMCFHSADTSHNLRIDLGELLRGIQYYNTGEFGCGQSEDGYLPRSTADQSCEPHDSDYAPQDWWVSLDELLRLIQFYNSLIYHCDPSGEDGFKPGPGATPVFLPPTDLVPDEDGFITFDVIGYDEEAHGDLTFIWDNVLDAAFQDPAIFVQVYEKLREQLRFLIVDGQIRIPVVQSPQDRDWLLGYVWQIADEPTRLSCGQSPCEDVAYPLADGNYSSLLDLNALSYGHFNVAEVSSEGEGEGEGATEGEGEGEGATEGEGEVANFNLNITIVGSGFYTLDTNVSDVFSKAAHIYPEDTTVLIEAFPSQGSYFEKFVVGGELEFPDFPRLSLDMTSDKEVEIVFAEIPDETEIDFVSLSVDEPVLGGGSTWPPAGVYQYPLIPGNSPLALFVTAIPEEGYRFVTWNSHVDTPNSATTSVTLDAHKTVIPVFEPIARDLVALSLTMEPESPIVGEEVVFTFTGRYDGNVPLTEEPFWTEQFWGSGFQYLYPDGVEQGFSPMITPEEPLMPGDGFTITRIGRFRLAAEADLWVYLNPNWGSYISESDYTNNSAQVEVMVQEPSEADVCGELISGSFESGLLNMVIDDVTYGWTVEYTPSDPYAHRQLPAIATDGAGDFYNGVAFEGNYYLQHGFMGDPGAQYVETYNNVLVPENSESATLSWAHRVQWDLPETYCPNCTEPHTIMVKVIGADGATAQVFSDEFMPHTSGDTEWQEFTYELSPEFIGQYVSIQFTQTVGHGWNGWMQFDLDAVCLELTEAPPAPPTIGDITVNTETGEVTVTFNGYTPEGAAMAKIELFNEINYADDPWEYWGVVTKPGGIAGHYWAISGSSVVLTYNQDNMRDLTARKLYLRVLSADAVTQFLNTDSAVADGDPLNLPEVTVGEVIETTSININ